MAKKLVYNYTFTPGASNVGTIQIEGNYPTKTWQLITDAGTSGVYKHTFVRDELFSSTGAIEVISGGSGNLAVATVGTSLDEDTGIMTVTTSTAHGLSTGATIKFREESITFTCAKDNYNSEKKYPRTTDPVYDTAIAITVVDSDTFTVDVGRPVGGAISSNNEIIYNFSDTDKSGSAYYDSGLDETTLTLHYDTSHLDYRDDLQIFLDIQEDKIDFSETFVDPVSKLRVSNPQNLIDTDFEYGLQPTKWETVELVNNIPSFYSNSSDYSIKNINSVSSIQGSQNINVNTSDPHGLSVGAPIDVQGLSSRTAEGKFIITKVIDDNTFVYKSKKPQESTTNLSGSYTVIIPGQFYEGSEIAHDEIKGIQTDGLLPSKLEIETEHDHGFDAGSSVYLTNTIGRKKYTMSQTGTNIAPDGRPYVDFEDTLDTSLNIDSSMTETKNMTGTYAYKFNSNSVNVANNQILWEGHGLRQGDVLLYVPPSGDTEIGGLERFQIYYVRDVASTGDALSLCETTNGNYTGNPIINFTSTGTSNYGRHQLILGYEFGYTRKVYNWRYVYTRYRYNSQGSGWDLQNYSVGGNTYYGLGREQPRMVMWADKSEGGIEYTSTSYSDIGPGVYRESSNSNFTFGKSGTEPDGYDFIEDWQRFSNSAYYRVLGTTGSNYVYTSYGQIYGYNNGGTYLGNSSTYFYYDNSTKRGKNFVFFVKEDSEADSFYVQNHGLLSGSDITFNTATGDDIKYRTDTGNILTTVPTWSTVGTGTTHQVQTLGSDRFRLSSAARLSKATGMYSLSGTITNPTKDSFYIADNDISDNEEVTLSSGLGGVIPSSNSGALTPKIGNLRSVFDGIKGALDGVRSTIGSTDLTRLWYNNSGNGYYPFRQQSTSFDGGRQYFRLYRQRMQVNLRNSSNSTQYQYGSYMYSNNNTYFNGEVHDAFADNTSIRDKGFNFISMPYEYNTYADYFLDVWQIPDIKGSESSLFHSGQPVEYASMSYQSYWSYNYNSHNTEIDRQPWNSWQTLAGGWKYYYTANYLKPDSNDHGYICISMIVNNDNWNGYAAPYSSSASQYYMYYNNQYLLPYTSPTITHVGQSYYATIIIPIKANVTTTKFGKTGTVITNAEIALEVATGIKDRLTFTALGAGTAKVKQIDGNRFSLYNLSNGFDYNITNTGTPPLQFATAEITGGADGYYQIDIQDEKKIQSFADAEIPQRELTFQHSGITSGAMGESVYVTIPNNKLRTGQSIKFDIINSSGTISGLTSGSNYYAIAIGPNEIEIANSAGDANAGASIGIGTTSAGSFKITIPSISGISQGIGTAGVTSTTNVITGTSTLFQRYFKVGDEFRIADTSLTPTRYENLTVQSVVSDLELTTNEIPSFAADTNYYVETKAYPRPDGAFLHRPFDGGVEINAGSSPNSSIVRQTRKYFRYQSGKGIQCSLAINFNPSRLAKSIVSSASTSIPVENYSINVNNSGSGSYNLSGTDRNARLFGQNEGVTIMKGDTVNFVVNASGHPLWVKTNQSTGTGNAVTTGITNNGAQTGTVTWDTTSINAGTYYYNCENHSSMSGSIVVESAGITTTLSKVSTEYPHGLTRNNTVTIRGATDNLYNGTFDIKASTDFDFTYYLSQVPSQSVPDGIIEYNIDSWTNSNIRCGLYDYQNGMFFEFDGNELWCVRRSSVQQLPGKTSVQKGDNTVSGTDTNFSGQLIAGDYVVIRGGSYRVTAIDSKTSMSIQPSYQGQTTTDAILTKTVDVKVRQSDWNIDKADGNGPSGFKIDLTKIQMAYMDYSWYGAGKIRFGFKDTYGHVKYMHEFRHNNRLEEAYMRTGNIAGRYEIENNGIPSYIPSLFHWGTSIIMDGKFDDDKAYLFTAASNSLRFTNGDSNTSSAAANSNVFGRWNWQNRNYDWYVRIPVASADASKFSVGTPLYTADGSLNGQSMSYGDYGGGNFRANIFVTSGSYPAVVPSVTQNETISIGAPTGGATASEIELTDAIPLISIRLAPSVDNNLTGSLGAREIINRMQLQLKSLGITVTHDCTIDIVLNGSISNRSFENVTSPSLSELIKHKSGDKITGGTTIFSLRASGGAENAAGRRLSATSDFDLSQITDLGNSILGGDGTYPNGPDLLTIALSPIDTAEINADTPLGVSSRVTWTESQA